MQVLRPDVPVQALRALAAPCRLCQLRCGVDRLNGQTGPCGAGPLARCYNAFVHLGEEPELVPCFTIFVSGCNFRCPHCSDGEWVDHPERGKILDPEQLAARIVARPDLRSVELVGGLPDVNLHHLAELVQGIPPSLPVVLNSNGWMSDEVVELLPRVVDLMLLDVKHGNDACARTLTGVSGYTARIEEVLLRTADSLRMGVWVRHLVLPGHLECCTEPALRRLARVAPGTVVNVLTQYRPLHRARGHAQLGRTLLQEERDALAPWLRGLHLELDLRLDGRRVGT